MFSTRAEKVLGGIILCLVIIFLTFGVGDAVVLSEEFESQGAAMMYAGHDLPEPPMGAILPGEWVVPHEVHSSQGYGKNRAVLVQAEFQYGWVSWEDYLLIRFGEPRKAGR